MSSKKKTLAQELAELYNPAPTREHDPDALDLGDGAKLASDDEYEEAQRAPSRRAPEKNMLLRGDIALEDAAYRGRKTSRAAMFGEQEEEGDMSDDDGDDEGEDVDLDLGGGSGDDGSDDEDGGDAGADRRATPGLAGPSGRKAAAAANGKKPGSSKAAPRPSSDDGEDDDEDDDLANGLLPSGSDEPGSDLDLEGADGTADGTDDFDEDDDVDGDDDMDQGQKGGRGDSEARAGPRRPAAAARGVAGRGEGGELEELEAEYEALQAEDEQQLAALREKGERDRVKGAAVRNQQVLYERALEQRILLQKCLQASNGLPRPDTHAALVRTQPDVREGFAQLADAARDTLSQLLDLQHTLMGRISGISLPPAAAASGRQDAAGAASGKRPRDEDDDDAEEEETAGGAAGPLGLDALWERISSHHTALAPYRDASLDSWHRRTVLSSGSGALRNSGLRALNQSISSQVQALMRDPAKFIKRTRLTLSTCPRVLCEPSREAAATSALDEDALLGQREGDVSAAAAAAGSASVAADVVEEERDGETYDDSEFYQQLLKEFLDKGIAQGAAAGAPKAAKKRKQVDRRASKGRKLRYHVQEKLVAFMAPVDFEPPSFAANLFANLFGHAGK